ncbi:tagatose-6-phosphate kinase-like protein [Leishmania major strain Friedlin]|uniref:Tagatose-6-phosphate kinase-like protein n=1 Tax=Leishmania major TaxID=5664 RepID=Q4Q9J4_LEIMA|nr:tagatose-6-phosphate kinase-like protein [Leishmania major strain Friedlin]CAG9575270.1 tagatose-6-phosphate_kinase-like_protein [Leishmania major strain Friedlin]CAJ05648.2 tagatose-6-phosphate kinase-like protein [Leishmania major strain Friedlin]|eukprot:XP_001684004.2 tagatose-6-phosphate kinase-like protein [Leishmania major strain Friedlin]
MGSPLIAVIGPNPAFQKTLAFDELRVDEVNRAATVHSYTGGKGTNFCRASACCKESPHFCRTTLHTFVGGKTGERVIDLLHQEGIAVYPVTVPAETRTCITCLDTQNSTMTELIEPSAAVPDDAAKDMDRALLKALEHAGGMAIMGSLPDGSSPDLYTRWTEMAAAAQKPVLIDAVKGIEASLKVPGVHSILKVNMRELNKLTGQSTPESAFEYAMQMWTVRVLAVTDGPRSAYIQERGQPLQVVHIPKVDGVVSPLGAGDTADAIFLAKYIHGTTPVEAFRLALAAASANCLQKEAGVFAQHEMRRIADGITIGSSRPHSSSNTRA